MDRAEMTQIKEFVRDMDKNQKVMYFEQKRKSVGMAVALSILIPELGQMYLGKVGKGILILLFSWLIIPWIYGIYDAYKYSKDYNALLYTIIFDSN
ncbi:TM2 domain [Geoglobus ahangari]|uniref:TM2 domain n=1 Tax=Geoglobus ahangari TaxID=113653 RepID=A0A0F7IFT4_9EURY|nr:hypothetical protein [Geoglobus ahangari]AKG91735.1 TM2 domain [Geoglobus ahangari]